MAPTAIVANGSAIVDKQLLLYIIILPDKQSKTDHIHRLPFVYHSRTTSHSGGGIEGANDWFDTESVFFQEDRTKGLIGLLPLVLLPSCSAGVAARDATFMRYITSQLAQASKQSHTTGNEMSGRPTSNDVALGKQAT